MASKAMKAAVPELTEKQIQAQIVEYLRWHGWFVSEIRERYSNGTGRYSDPGIPDIVAIKDGRTIWLEVKTPKGKVRPSQLKWHEECRAKGGEVYVLRGVEELVYFKKTLIVEGDKKPNIERKEKIHADEGQDNEEEWHGSDSNTCHYCCRAIRSIP